MSNVFFRVVASTINQWLYAVSCGTRQSHLAVAGTNGLAGRCLSLDILR